MKYSDHYRFKLPERDDDSADSADVNDLNENFEKIDEELHAQATGKADQTALDSHRENSILDHPDGSVTDEKIGVRSIGGVTGFLTALFSNIASAFSGLKGTESWNDTPPVTLQGARDHIDDDTLHIPAGGTAGQVLTKDSGEDRDVSWKDLQGGGGGGVFTVNGQEPDENGDVTITEIENAQKLDGKDAGYYKSAFLKFTGGASSLPSGQAYGLHAQTLVTNTENVPVEWDDRDFVIPEGYNFVHFWGGVYGIGGAVGNLQDFGYVSCHVALNGDTEGATVTGDLLNPGRLTFCNTSYLGFTHDCFTGPCLLKVQPGDRIGFRIACYKNSFYIYSKIFCIELMKV